MPFVSLVIPEISSSSSSDWKLLLFSQVGGEYFFLVTYCRPMVLLAVFTRFLESVLTETEGKLFKNTSLCC